MSVEQCYALLRAKVGDKVRRDGPLGPRTTYRVGGAAAVLLEAEAMADLEAARDAVVATGVATLVVGNGSNLLVADAGFEGLAVCLGDTFAGIEVDAGFEGLAVCLGDTFAGIEVDGTTVRAGGAALLPVVARRTAAAGLTGFEWAVGVPGSIGGAVRMNAGGHGADMAASLTSIRVLDLAGGDDGEVPVDALALGYRRSNLGPRAVVLEATLGLAEGDAEAGQAAIDEIVRWRRANQPGGANAGSVFTNPPGDAAGRLVEEVGAKGLRLGTAAVSDKHGNFIQADAGGSADDVLALMREVQRRVHTQTGTELHPETVLIGFGNAAFDGPAQAPQELEG